MTHTANKDRSKDDSYKLKVLDLFSGIGGFSLGLERTGGFETVAFCEIDKFCQKVLKKHWPDVPIYEDVRTLEHDGPVDVITGGYPCQPFSVAGKRKGENDDRHLWPAMFSLIKKHRPTWVIGENVTGHVTMGLDSVLSDLGREGYSARTFIIPACAVDAKHRRDRCWIVACTDASCKGLDKRDLLGRVQGKKKQAERGEALVMGCQASARKTVADSSSQRLQRQGESVSTGNSAQETPWKTAEFINGSKRAEWGVEPGVGRVADGVPRRVDRLRSLGNTVVPQIPEIIGRSILKAEAATV